ncbi:hypothetical protein AA0N74_07935 [Chromobacterium vaccinii]|uniref:hypothetical protein n=1 Tax=Chromobacterium vaccinii TaxID=1108595 RepID=UPI0031D5EAD8
MQTAQRTQCSGLVHSIFGAQCLLLDVADARSIPSQLAYADANRGTAPAAAQSMIEQAFAPCPVLRNEHGFWDHPAMVASDLNMDWPEWYARYGYQFATSTMADDADGANLLAIYDETGCCHLWEPLPPDAGAGWQLQSIFAADEIGPVALWIRPAAAAMGCAA